MALTVNTTTYDLDNNLTDLLVRNFNTEDQKLFVQSFKMYLEYGDDDTKFVISLDDIWQWLGFSRIDPCKRLLIKNFIENRDFIISFHRLVEQKTNSENRGGHNKQIIMLNVVDIMICLLYFLTTPLAYVENVL